MKLAKMPFIPYELESEIRIFIINISVKYLVFVL
jgi:hypothetical protein